MSGPYIHITDRGYDLETLRVRVWKITNAPKTHLIESLRLAPKADGSDDVAIAGLAHGNPVMSRGPSRIPAR